MSLLLVATDDQGNPIELAAMDAAIIQPGATLIICPADDRSCFTDADVARVRDGFARLGIQALFFRVPIRVWQVPPGDSI